MNFGTVSKSDFEVLMFSIYIEQILENEQENFNAYSDYTLSKYLGITQAKVSNLKIKKELMYPYSKFTWQDSFKRIADRAVYENGKIKLMIPDKNLYLEIKNKIETAGGYVEAQLTSNLLQVRIEYYLDFLIALSDEKDRNALRKKIKAKIKEDNKDLKIIEKEPFGKFFLNKTPEFILTSIERCTYHLPETILSIAKILTPIIENALNSML